MEESDEEVDDRMEVEEEEERAPVRASASSAGKKRASRARADDDTPPKRARRQAEEEGEEGEGPDDEYVDPRFNKAAPPPPPPPPPAPAGTGRLSWGDPTSYLPSFWRTRASGGGSGGGGGSGYSSPGSPSKRVAFREEVEEFDTAVPPQPPRRSSLGPAPSSSSSSGRRRSSAPLPPLSPTRSILKKTRPAHPPSHEGEEEDEDEAARLRQQQQQEQGRISFVGTLQPVAALLRQCLAHGAVLLLGLTVVAAWVLVLGGLLWGLHSLLWREGCPPGQVREGWLGLWGECMVSTRTVRQLVRALERETVRRLCGDMPWRPWGSKYGQAGALEEGSPLLPVSSVAEVWAGPLGITEYPWRDLEERGVERAFGASLHHDYRVSLRGRPEVLRALWREWAVPCRCKLLLAEHWQLAALAALGLLVLLWAYLTARSRRRARREAERVKRVVLDLLAAEGEIAPEHARDELLHHLPREYRHLGLSRAGLKRLWPRVVRLVERDSRVTKAPRERHGRAIAHWVWMGRRSSSVRHQHQPLQPIHEEGQGHHGHAGQGGGGGGGGGGGEGGVRARVV
jgi:hypothetical protein